MSEISEIPGLEYQLLETVRLFVSMYHSIYCIFYGVKGMLIPTSDPIPCKHELMESAWQDVQRTLHVNRKILGWIHRVLGYCCGETNLTNYPLFGETMLCALYWSCSVIIIACSAMFKVIRRIVTV